MSEHAVTTSLPVPMPSQDIAWCATPHHPWRRMFATVYDMVVFSLLGMTVIGIVIGLFSPAAEHGLSALLDAPVKKYAGYFLSGLVATPLMAFFLAEFGATPGKWIWGIKLERKDSGLRPFPIMLQRELMMFFLGYGANLGPAPIIFGVLSRSTLLRTGETQWDATYGTRILYRENSVYRIVIGVSVLLCVLLVISKLPDSQ